MYRKENNRNKQKKSYNFNVIHDVSTKNLASQEEIISGLNVITAFITMWTKLFLYEFAK
jgi:hypothetical protein